MKSLARTYLGKLMYFYQQLLGLGNTFTNSCEAVVVLLPTVARPRLYFYQQFVGQCCTSTYSCHAKVVLIPTVARPRLYFYQQFVGLD